MAGPAAAPDPRPAVESLPPGWELWLDGGHNPAAGKVLADFARNWRDRPLDVVWGMLSTKDAGGFLKLLAPRVRRLRAIAVPGETATQDPRLLAETARAEGVADAAAPSPEAALAQLAGLAADDPAPARVLICGSLYLAGAVLSANG